MKPNLNTFILIAGFIVVIWFLRNCGSQNENLEPVKSETVLRYDTTIHLVHTHKIYYKPAEVVYDSLFTLVKEDGTRDSSEIQRLVDDYFTRRPFTDSISNDSIDITYSGDIWKNSLFNPEIRFKWKAPVSIETNIHQPPPLKTGKLSLGLFAGYSSEPFIGGLAMYSDRRDRSILVGYGTGKTVLIGMGWKISFRKR